MLAGCDAFPWPWGMVTRSLCFCVAALSRDRSRTGRVRLFWTGSTSFASTPVFVVIQSQVRQRVNPFRCHAPSISIRKQENEYCLLIYSLQKQRLYGASRPGIKALFNRPRFEDYT